MTDQPNVIGDVSAEPPEPEQHPIPVTDQSEDVKLFPDQTPVLLPEERAGA